jgi:hypothetical protein
MLKIRSEAMKVLRDYYTNAKTLNPIPYVLNYTPYTLNSEP